MLRGSELLVVDAVGGGVRLEHRVARSVAVRPVRVLDPRGLGARDVAQHGDDPRLVDRHPVLHLHTRTGAAFFFFRKIQVHVSGEKGNLQKLVRTLLWLKLRPKPKFR